MDATGIHPEMYDKTYQFLEKELGITKKKLVLPLQDAKLQTANDRQIEQRSATYDIGFETLSDIIKELQRPGLDPRENMDPPSFKSDVLETKDLHI